ncbi:MAG: SDR family NAD(P)-dependent oxidoreductase [Gemmatimonadota bacterium]|nr:SDR family NAD(P)-dependent oxidoreductase [Gemmatimonadota bacterium]
MERQSREPSRQKGRAYAASKFGVRGLHEVPLAELRGSGVRASLISPSAVDTNLWDPIDTEAADSAFPARASMSSAAEVARAVMFAVTRPQGVNIDELRMSSG